jgi:NADPH-dependent glutamate synthase beta subunit-like oxidoreductase
LLKLALNSDIVIPGSSTTRYVAASDILRGNCKSDRLLEAWSGDKESGCDLCTVQILGGDVTAFDIAAHAIQFCVFEVRCAASASLMLTTFA